MTRIISVLLVAIVALAAYFVAQKTWADSSVAADVKRIADMIEKGCR